MSKKDNENKFENYWVLSLSIFVENIKILAIESYGTILNKKVDVISNYKAYKLHCSPDEC